MKYMKYMKCISRIHDMHFSFSCKYMKCISRLPFPDINPTSRAISCKLFPTSARHQGPRAGGWGQRGLGGTGRGAWHAGNWEGDYEKLGGDWKGSLGWRGLGRRPGGGWGRPGGEFGLEAGRSFTIPYSAHPYLCFVQAGNLGTRHLKCRVEERLGYSEDLCYILLQ